MSDKQSANANIYNFTQTHNINGQDTSKRMRELKYAYNCCKPLKCFIFLTHEMEWKMNLQQNISTVFGCVCQQGTKDRVVVVIFLSDTITIAYNSSRHVTEKSNSCWISAWKKRATKTKLKLCVCKIDAITLSKWNKM